MIDVKTNAFEQLFDRQVRFARELQESRRIGAVASGSVERLRSRRRRVTDDRAVRRIDDRKSAPGIVDGWEWIVPAGVEHDNAHPARDRFQRRHHVDQADRVGGKIGRRGNLRVDRDKVVLSCKLHAVSGIIDHGDRVGSACGNPGREVLHDLDHVAVRQIGRFNHLEARRVQELRHRLRVVIGIEKRRRALVFRIADHQRNPLLGTLNSVGDCGVGGLSQGNAVGEAQQATQQAGAQQQ